MRDAVESARFAMAEGWRIAVLFDVDVDGCCAGAIVTRALRRFGGNVDPLINHGRRHGIGGQPEELLLQYGLLIACDSGSGEFDLYERLHQAGLEIVLLDHHRAPHYSDYAVTVNSEMGSYENPALSGAGVCLKFVQGLDEAFGSSIAGKYADLAATGIVADVMDLSSMENRSVCRRGFSSLQNPFLKEVIGAYPFNAQAVSFSIAPLVNALCRQGENQLAMQMVLCDDEREVRRLIRQAKAVKEVQDRLVSETMADLILQFQHQDMLGDHVLIGFTGAKEIAGLAATKIADLFARPAIILHDDSGENGVLTGSMRGRGSDSFRELINSTGIGRAQGHDNAAGVYVGEKDLPAFKEALEQALQNHPPRLVREIDFEAKIPMLDFDLISRIEAANRISGAGFPPVSCALRGLVPDAAATMKDKHTKLVCGELELLCWNNTDLFEAVNSEEFCCLDVAGTPAAGNFRGKKSRQLIVSDYIIHNDLPFQLAGKP